MKQNNIAILNRGEVLPDDGWYQVVPLGEFVVKHGGKRILQVLDPRAVQAMAERFQAAGEKLLVDFDHFSYDEGNRSEAAGWVVAVEARTDGLWARIEWTDAGEPAIMNKRYRFVSPVWLPDDCEDLGNDRLRPLRLDSIGLTNQPNMKGMQPLSNRGGEGRLPNSHPTKENTMKKVLELLGLSAEATEDSAVEAVTALQNSASESGALKNRAEQAETKIAEMETAALESEADAFCDEHKDVIANRDAVKAQYIANREGTRALFAGIKPAADEPDGQEPIHNRQRKPDEGKVDEKKAAAIRNRAQAIRKERGIPYPQAFAAAQDELG